MKGFFTEREIEEDFAQKSNLVNPLPLCGKCGLYNGLKHPKTDWTGKGRKKCLIVAEAMGKDEDDVGKQLVGETGTFLKDCLKEIGLDLELDFYKINAVNCRPVAKDSDANRTPTKIEVKCCRPMVEKAIVDLKPEFIWLLGGTAVESFYMNDFSRLAISRWRKLCIPDSRYNAWIIPMFHPSFAKRSESDLNLEAVYKADLKRAASCLNKEPYKHEDVKERCVCLYDFGKIKEVLEEVLAREPMHFFFDYETTGIKAQHPGHRIATISFAVKTLQGGSYLDTKAYSFPYQYAGHFTKQEQIEIKRLWRAIMKNTKIGKICHNLKFEYIWTKFIMGCPIINPKFCTMTCAHILDCRKDITGLKFQSYINFGIYPYDKHIKPFLKDTGNGFNRVDEAPLSDLLLYGGMDSWLTKLLYYKQMEQMTLTEGMSQRNKLAQAYQFFHQGTLAFSEIQCNGIPMNEDYYAAKDKELAEDKKRLLVKIMESDEAKKYHEQTNRKIDIGSPKQLGKLFKDILNVPLLISAKGNPKVDEKELLSIGSPFSLNILKYRKLDKIHSTYFAEFKREMCNGMMYPFFDLNIPISYRSSSSKPNFHNIPNRDREAKKICRSGIVPSPGNRILEDDYSGIEVCVAACYTQDPSLVKYVSDPKTDMHRDAAADLWMIEVEDVTSEMRFFGKNCWVFPQFYGSYYGSCAPDLWENVIEADLQTKRGEPVFEVLRDRGISTLEEFTEHCKSVEHIFWNERFKIYKQWKDNIQGVFQRKGYIETFFGFRFTGYLTYNQVSNLPIQGTAFHVLLWTLIRLMEEAKRDKWRSKIMGQIHDSIVWDADPDEMDHIIERTDEIGTKLILSEHPWINVPLKIDHEASPVNGSWFEKEAVR